MAGAAARTGYLGLGSNVGEPAEHLRAALALLPPRGVAIEAVSSVYVDRAGRARSSTSPTSSTPRSASAPRSSREALLDACKAVEAERGRAFDQPRHSPRPLDVDLLLLGDLELREDRLTLPHPQVDQPPLRAGAAARAGPRADPARRHPAGRGAWRRCPRMSSGSNG